MDPFSGVTDHDLLAGGVADVWAVNLASANQWARLVEFHRRREAAFDAHEREPVSDQWPEVDTGIHHCADEILRALDVIRTWREADRAGALHLLTHRELWRECDAPDWDPSDGLELLPEYAA